MGENYKAFSVTIEKLLEEKKYASLRDILTTINPADIALIFAEIVEEKLPLLFRLLPKELAAEAFVEMDDDMQEHLIRGFSDAELKAVVDELYVDDAVDIVEEMPANVVKRVLKQADPELRKMINEILKYPEDSAGSIMTTEYLSLRPQMTVEEAIKRIRRTCVDKETIYTCYVTDQNRTLIGMLSLKDLLVAEDDDIVENIMETNVICVETHTDQEEVAQSLSKYNFMALPVVDKETRLVGIVTFDDAIDVIEEETTEDIEMMAAITPTDKPYLRTSVFEIWKKRIPWLLLLMISATFTTLIISSFESALAAHIALTSFIPMIMGTGGNSGSQSSVTIIRGLSLDEIEFSDIVRVIWKETRVAVLCGLTLAVANFFKLMLLEGVDLMASLTISLTLVITVLVAKVIGSSLPMLAKKIGFDPAVMASPLITTMVDALSLLVYFSTATALLGI